MYNPKKVRCNERSKVCFVRGRDVFWVFCNEDDDEVVEERSRLVAVASEKTDRLTSATDE